MTLNEVKAMFRADKFWTMRKWSDDMTVIGNTGNTVFKSDSGEPQQRAVVQVRSADVIWMRADGTVSYMPYPKASEIIEAKPGYLRFCYADTQVTIELTKVGDE